MLASNFRTRTVAGVCLLMLTLAGAVLLACETPVYRYAMYRWAPEPYEVYYFHEGESSAALGEAEADVHKALEDAAEEWANVSLIKIDLSVENAIERVPPDVHQWWTSEENRQPPLYLVKNPMGFVVHSGSLTKADVADMVQSPVRQALGERLERGEAAVFLLLEGANAAANQIAERELAGIVKDVNSGEIDLYTSPLSALPVGSESGGNASQEDTLEGDAANPEASSQKVKVGYLVVRRDDPKERWLIDSLLAVESDLPELSGPMVFGVYGRARALPPYVGAGITRDNLQDCIEFVTGACSCTVKEENPGVDLLLTYNWDDAALALKEKFGSEEGNESQFGGLDLFPQLIVAGEVPEDGEPADAAPTAEGVKADMEAAMETDAATEAAASETTTSDGESSDAQPAAEASKDVALVETEEESKRNEAATVETVGEKPVGGVTLAPSNRVRVPTVSRTLNTPLFLIVGAGVAFALFLLIGATFFMFRGH